MGAQLIRNDGSVPSKADLEALLARQAQSPRWWSNPPDDRYGWHTHGYHKVLYCLSGSITFHTKEGDLELRSGDRLEIEPGTDHAATVGPQGVECVEAQR